MPIAQVLVVANSKGGCGKSTLSLCLAASYAGLGADVMVIDADPAGTATHWVASAPESRPFPATLIGLGNAGAKLHQLMEPHITRYDKIIVDCPPSTEDSAIDRTRSALLVADLCLVPTQPTPNDFWASQGIFELISHVRRTNQTLRTLVVPTRVGRGRVGDAVLQTLREGKDEVLRSVLKNRVSYQEAALRGSAPDRLGTAHRRAALEVAQMAEEINVRMGWV